MTFNDDFDLRMTRKLVMGELVAKNARKFPDREGVVFQNKRYTFKEFDARVNRVANALIDMGLQRGEKVAILSYNSSEMLECFIGIAKANAVSVPINFRLAPREVEYIVNNSDAGIFIFDHRFLPTVKAIKSDLLQVKNYVVFGGQDDSMEEYEDLLQRYTHIRPEVLVEDEDDALILYTSGTTGRPKGAVLSHKNVLLNIMTTAFESGFKLGDSQVLVAPMYHCSGLNSCLIQFYVSGNTVILESFDPRAVLEAVDREKVDYVFMVPAMWLAVLQLSDLDRYDCSSLRLAGTAGSIMPIEVKKRIMQRFPNIGIFDTFGQTEMSPCTTTLKPEFAAVKQGSVGQALTLVEFRVVDDSDNDVPVGEIGEIIYRGPSAMKGYYKNPEATAASFKGGWFHSGDLVRVDNEGFVYVVDRKKDMIISGGENIYPAEIEEIIYGHPDVVEAAVIGLPDEKWGESVKAVIVVNPGKTVTSEEIVSFCSQHLARYKLPRMVEFVDMLPRNASGKVLKTTLRERYGNPQKLKPAGLEEA